MELAELKTIWKFVNADISKRRFIDEQTMHETINKKSDTELGNLRRTLQLKLTIGSIVTAIGVVLMMALAWSPDKFNTLDFVFSHRETLIFYATLVISLVAMLWFNYQAYRKTVDAETQSLNLKQSLETVIKAMENAMRFNIYSDTLISPIILTWLVYAYQDEPFTWGLRAWILLILPFAIGVTAYYVQRYVQKLKFGNYVNRLRSYLKELE